MNQISLVNLGEIRKTSAKNFPRKINPQLYFFNLGEDSICAYTPAGNVTATLTREEYEFVRNNYIVNSNIKGMEALIGSFLYDAPQINLNYSENEVLSFKPNIDATKIKELSVIVSTACNLRCRYCFAFGGESTEIEKQKNVSGLKQELDPNTALYAINYFKPTRITLFGWGEPTMAFSNIKKIVSGIDTEKTKVEIVTNGVYFSRREEIVKYLVEHNIKIQISFDGLPKFQDTNRPMSNGTGSSNEVLKTINEIKKYGRLGDLATVRATICGGMEDYILESVDYLHELGFDIIGIQPVEISGRAVNNIKPLNMSLFARNVAKAIAYGKRHGININSRVLPASDNWSMACYGCGFMAGYMLALGPDNNFYSCDDPLPIFKVGTINGHGSDFEVDVDYKKVTDFANKRYILNLDNCRECPVKCGGGCAKESFSHYDKIDIGGESEELCNARREALAEYIKAAVLE